MKENKFVTLIPTQSKSYDFWGHAWCNGGVMGALLIKWWHCWYNWGVICVMGCYWCDGRRPETDPIIV